MKKIIVLLLVLSAFVLLKPTDTSALNDHEFVVSNFKELEYAVSKTSFMYETTIVINGTVEVEKNISVGGIVTFKGNGNSKLALEHNGIRTTITNKLNAELKFQDLTIYRSFSEEKEAHGIYFRYNGNGYFEDVTFDVATPELGPSPSNDRLTYVPNDTNVTLYFNHCTFDTAAYFYRGTMVFYNGNDKIPTTAGNAVTKDFNSLTIDYETQVITFPSSITVSEDLKNTKVVNSGSQFKSKTTYYATKDGYTFTFTTKNLKLATPTLASVEVDYTNEVINFSNKYLVALDSNFSQLVKSGDKVTPGMKLYIKQLSEGIFTESSVAEVTLPQRPTAISLESDFECEFGFVMQLHNDVEFSIGDRYQASPVFVGLESKTTYTVKMRVKATNSSFASLPIEITVTTK